MKFKDDNESVTNFNDFNTKNSNSISVVPSEIASSRKDKNEDKIINLIQCPVNDSPITFKKIKTRKAYDVINEPFSDKQLYYVKKILFEEEILIDGTKQQCKIFI